LVSAIYSSFVFVCVAEGKHLSQEAERHYNSATKSKVYADGNIPNVIKAYYVAYLPDPKYVFPTVDIKPPTASTSVSSEVSRKRSHDDIIHSSTDNMYSTNNARTDTYKNKIEIFESKKYPGKYFFTDSKTNNSVWVEIKRNNPQGEGENVFNANSDVADYHFFDNKNEKFGILKANFASK
jgi:hypothetical protein